MLSTGVIVFGIVASCVGAIIVYVTSLGAAQASSITVASALSGTWTMFVINPINWVLGLASNSDLFISLSGWLILIFMLVVTFFLLVPIVDDIWDKRGATRAVARR